MSVTLRDVAKAAGVSVATASRALHDPASTTEAMRVRVGEVAKDLHYHPNTAARSLRTRRTDTIGLLVPDVRNPFFTDLAYEIDKAAAAAGLTVMMGSSDESPAAADRYLTNLARHQVDGLLVVPQMPTSRALRRACETRPTVFLDRHPDLDGPVVTSADSSGMAALVDHVVAQGYRRIGLISGPVSASTGRTRRDAFVRRLAELGLPHDESLVAYGDFRLESGITAAAELLARPHRPDAIVAADNPMALGVLTQLRRQGLRIGRDVGFAAFDDNPWFEVVDPPVTVVAHDTARLGETAVAALVDLIGGGQATSTVIPTRLVVRESLGEGASATGTPREAGRRTVRQASTDTRAHIDEGRPHG